jgi:hypothetical protein
MDAHSDIDSCTSPMLDHNHDCVQILGVHHTVVASLPCVHHSIFLKEGEEQGNRANRTA